MWDNNKFRTISVSVFIIILILILGISSQQFVDGRDLLETKIIKVSSIEGPNYYPLNNKSYDNKYDALIKIKYEVWNENSYDLVLYDIEWCDIILIGNLTELLTTENPDPCINRSIWGELIFQPGITHFEFQQTYYDTPNNTGNYQFAVSYNSDFENTEYINNFGESYLSSVTIDNFNSFNMSLPNPPRNWGQIDYTGIKSSFLHFRISEFVLEFLPSDQSSYQYFTISGLEEINNPTSDLLFIGYPNSCTWTNSFIFDFDNYSHYVHEKLYEDGCLDAVTTIGYEPGKLKTDFAYSFYVANGNLTAIPNGTVYLSSNIDVNVRNKYFASITFENDEFSIKYNQVMFAPGWIDSYQTYPYDTISSEEASLYISITPILLAFLIIKKVPRKLKLDIIP